VYYHQQATVAAAISSLQFLSSAIVRIPITGGFANFVVFSQIAMDVYFILDLVVQV
jgi:hypothetical protein